MSDNPFARDYVEPADDVDVFGLPPIGGAAPKPKSGNVVYHNEFEQGSEQWHAARRGLITASEMKLILTPKTLKVASNKEEKLHLYELLAQRVTGYVEPHFESYDMERGKFDEEHARGKYAEHFAPVTECGFITNDRWGFTLGYSPDGLIGDDGLIECKSRVQRHQMRTLVECVAVDAVPEDFILQVQTGLLVSEREWLDFVSYSGGMVMSVVRCFPDPIVQRAIVDAATAYEERIAEARRVYDNLIASDARLIPTERLIYL